MIRSFHKLVLPGSMLMLAACSDTTSPGAQGRASLSFATSLPAGAVPAPSFAMAASGVDSIRSGNDLLVITRAEVVMREIELKRAEVGACDATPKPSECEEIESGPMLVDLPLGAGTEQVIAVDIPAGTYREVDFEVHKVSKDDTEDAAFRLAHPDFVEKSIRVQGTFNGQTFTYETDLDAEQEIALVPPMVVADGTTPTNLTIRFTVADWFRSLAGGLVDPATGNKGGANESLIKENIKKSIHAFEDDDRDGDER